MQTMNISLPDPLKEFIEAQVSSGRYDSVSQYFRELVRQDEKRRAREQLDSLLFEGLRSGAPGEMTRQDWEAIRREALTGIKDRTSRRTRQ